MGFRQKFLAECFSSETFHQKLRRKEKGFPAAFPLQKNKISGKSPTETEPEFPVETLNDSSLYDQRI